MALHPYYAGLARSEHIDELTYKERAARHGRDLTKRPCSEHGFGHRFGHRLDCPHCRRAERENPLTAAPLPPQGTSDGQPSTQTAVAHSDGTTPKGNTPMLYRVAITQPPSQLDAQAGKGEELVLPVTDVLANSNGQAIALAVFQNHDALAEKAKTLPPNRWQIQVGSSGLNQQ